MIQISGTGEGESMEDTGKLEERNKIVSELQTIIKERIELKEIEIPGTITFQVMSVDGGNVPVGAGEVLLLRYSATHLEYSHELEDEEQKFHMALHLTFTFGSSIFFLNHFTACIFYIEAIVPFFSFFSNRSFCHNCMSPFDIRQSELLKCFLRVGILWTSP